MCALYNATGICFIGGKLYLGHFSAEPEGTKYHCADWVILSKQIFATILDRDIMSTVIWDMAALEKLKISKMSTACYLLDGKPEGAHIYSHFYLKTNKLTLSLLSGQSSNDDTWLQVLWSYGNDEQPL